MICADGVVAPLRKNAASSVVSVAAPALQLQAVTIAPKAACRTAVLVIPKPSTSAAIPDRENYVSAADVAELTAA